jgi:hypothetical protein
MEVMAVVMAVVQLAAGCWVLARLGDAGRRWATLSDAEPH